MIFEPQDFLAKLAALVPAPRVHLVRFHGVLGPAAAWRSLIIPTATNNRMESAPAEGNAVISSDSVDAADVEGPQQNRRNGAAGIISGRS